MKVVIDIPEEAYKLLNNEGVDWLGAEHILNAVANGTPLPKGHGRLIDSDELSNRLLERWEIADKNMEKLVSNVMADIVCPIVIGTPTIIEAESEEKE